jgi:hypothetical protein
MSRTRPPYPPEFRQEAVRLLRSGDASVHIAAGSRSALVIARIGTGTGARRVLARVEWGRTRRYGHRTAWRVVRPTIGLRRVRFRIGPLPAHGRAHVCAVESASHVRRSRRREEGPVRRARREPAAAPRR